MRWCLGRGVGSGGGLRVPVGSFQQHGGGAGWGGVAFPPTPRCPSLLEPGDCSSLCWPSAAAALREGPQRGADVVQPGGEGGGSRWGGEGWPGSPRRLPVAPAPAGAPTEQRLDWRLPGVTFPRPQPPWDAAGPGPSFPTRVRAAVAPEGNLVIGDGAPCSLPPSG